MNHPKIHIELVPKTCWFTNVRSQVSKEAWDWLRRETYKQAGHKCEVCGTKGKMEAHEIWHYDDQKLIQKLHSLVCVCNACHQLYHLGYASINGKLPQAIKHLSKVNAWSKAETEQYVEAVFEIWYHRSQKQWKLDLQLLDDCGIAYNKIKPKDRKKYMEEQLK